MHHPIVTAYYKIINWINQTNKHRYIFNIRMCLCAFLVEEKTPPKE